MSCVQLPEGGCQAVCPLALDLVGGLVCPEFSKSNSGVAGKSLACAIFVFNFLISHSHLHFLCRSSKVKMSLRIWLWSQTSIHTWWYTPLACGPSSSELSKSYMDMATKIFTFTFTSCNWIFPEWPECPAAVMPVTAGMLQEQCASVCACIIPRCASARSLLCDYFNANETEVATAVTDRSWLAYRRPRSRAGIVAAKRESLTEYA